MGAPRSESKPSARAKFLWLEALASDPKISDAAFRVGFVIAKFANASTLTAWPSQQTIASMSNRTTRSVRDMVQILADAGFLNVSVARGRKHTNRYTLVLKNRNAHSSFEAGKEEHAFPIYELETGKFQNEKRKFPVEKEERPFLKNKKRKMVGKSIERERGTDQCSEVGCQEFEEFWSAYPNKQARPAAEREFALAVQSASAPEVIAGARRYATECLGRESRFIAAPERWLANRRWNDQTSQSGRVIDQHGNEIALSPAPNDRTRRSGWREAGAALAARLGGEK